MRRQPEPEFDSATIKKELTGTPQLRGFVLLGMAALGTSAAQPPTAVTFAHDIAPIIYNNCSSCHRPGESAPFSLLSYEDVRKHARQIALVTKTRFMPPWLPQAGYGEFADE